MATRQPVTIPTGSASPPLVPECSLPHMVNFPENGIHVVPLDISLASQALSTSTAENESHLDLSLLLAKSRPLMEIESIEGSIPDDAYLEAASVKSKRSSSTSNDFSYERDRFRARFKTFNTNSPVVSEEEDIQLSTTGETKIYRFPSQKTKKLNGSARCPTEAILDLLSNYSIREPISPLDKASSFFNRHITPLESTPNTTSFVIYSISVSQLSNVFHWYFNNPLPSTSRMFPWLHGLHGENYAQKAFFASQNLIQKFAGDSYASLADLDLEIEKPKDVRFLMCVESSPAPTHLAKVLRNTVRTDEILHRIQYSRQEVCLQIKTLIASFIPSADQSQGEWTGITDQIISDCFETGFMPQFIDQDPKRGISLRNFHIQANKVARCSDIVVYCLSEKHKSNSCKCEPLARLIRVAQIIENKHLIPFYNVFVLLLNDVKNEESLSDVMTVRDNSSIFTGLDHSKKTQLLLYSMVLLKSETFQSWDADYFVKEKVETTRMSAASRLHLNVWSGNIWDYQTMMQVLKGSNSDSIPDHKFLISPNSDHRFEYCNPKNSTLIKDKSFSVGSNLVSMLPSPRAHWQLLVLCHSEAQFPTDSQIQELLFKYTITSHKASDVSDFHLLEFPSSGSIGLGDCKQTSLMSFVNTCKLMYLYSSCMTEDGLATLIYCSDGYTELSLLILSYLMFAENVSLDEAIINLHNKYGRPFYLFSNDVQVLRKVEPLLKRFSPKVLGSEIVWSKVETITTAEFNNILLGKNLGIQERKRSIPRRLRLGYVANDLDSSSTDSDEEVSEDHSSVYDDHHWVEEVEGSLPSRILPYLYLGSLRHANNLTVLSKLGISKVVSVGETVDWIHGFRFKSEHEILVKHVDGENLEIYTIKPKSASSPDKAKPSSSGSNLQCSVQDIMKVSNLQDDGIDELSKALPRILEFIDNEYKKSNGATKILVHCRVGVSRSASVVIAEVMKRYGLNLPQAYLYVRVRRLNIVIQPNLRFMYELFKWEELERIKKRQEDSGDLRVIDWFVMCQEIKKLNLPFVSN
ncbi:hypothetical protein PUMCH_000936 [Australozyma saopauloensis]|uniref:Protein-tyrosine-phosphatase n=1 Tax=Australozyma saopauloensis TaxID=291208 RepID=A0AAX4H614_9ASCO|nr:hypothetical protein PUMCH_000936 [[Candida] saopauloensis]